MSAPPSVAQWAHLVATQLPHLSQPQTLAVEACFAPLLRWVLQW